MTWVEGEVYIFKKGEKKKSLEIFILENSNAKAIYKNITKGTNTSMAKKRKIEGATRSFKKRKKCKEKEEKSKLINTFR